MKSKVQTAPKQLLRRGLDDGTERLRGQLRDASQRGQSDGYGGDQIEDAAWSGTRWGTRGIEKLLKAKKDGRKHTPEAEPASDADIPEGECPEPAPAEPSAPESRTDRVRIKTWETVSEFPETVPKFPEKRTRLPAASTPNGRNPCLRSAPHRGAVQSVSVLKYGRLFLSSRRLFLSSRKRTRLPAAGTSKGRNPRQQSDPRRGAAQIVFGSRHGRLFLSSRKYVHLPADRAGNHLRQSERRQMFPGKITQIRRK